MVACFIYLPLINLLLRRLKKQINPMKIKDLFGDFNFNGAEYGPSNINYLLFAGDES